MTETNKISALSPEISEMSQDWAMLSALMGGTRAMREAGKTFLPQWPNEDAESYKARLSVSTLYPAFRRTVEIMSAKPFVQDMTMEPNIPSALTILVDDCDRQGTKINEFFADRFAECLSHGLTGVLVDHTPFSAKTVKEEKTLGARPYFCSYKPQSILGFRVEDGVLTMVRLIESVRVYDDNFGESTIEQIRVLSKGAWQLYRKNQKDEWVLFGEGATTIDFVPFVFFYGKKLSFGVGQTPLIDLAYQNVEHWQSSSDQQSILHVARVPILFARGFGDSTITIGAGSAVSTGEENAELKWVEHTGQSINAGKESILALEERMRQAGSEMLVKRAGNTTATQVLSDNEANKSQLQNIVEEFENGIELCLRYAAKWKSIEYVPDVDLYKDFSVEADSVEIDYLLKAQMQEIVTKDEVKNELIRRGVLKQTESSEK
jgi:Domain of unknown function (DUF4055)